MVEIRNCMQCKKQLYGRADQIYCNDTCRNTFNKHKTKQEKLPPHVNQKIIFKIIQRNYEILMKLPPKGIYPGHGLKIKIEEVPLQFNRKFFTSTQQTEEGTWYICFDRGWREEERFICLKDFPEKAIV